MDDGGAAGADAAAPTPQVDIAFDPDDDGEHGVLLKVLMRRLVERELMRARAFSGGTLQASCRERTTATVKEIIATLRRMLARMLLRRCSSEQLVAVQQRAVRILLVGTVGNFQQFTDALGYWLEQVEQWPKAPVAPRDPTLPETLYFFLEGQILRLQHTDPLPEPEFLPRPELDYCCFLCKQPVVASYQAVDIDGLRDRTTYCPNRRGLDICAACARKYRKKGVRRLQDRITSCPFSRRNHISSCSQGRLRVEAVSFSAYKDTIVLHLKGTPGLAVVACAYPHTETKRNLPTVPASWLQGTPTFATRLAPPDGHGRVCTICAEDVFVDTAHCGPAVTTPCGHEFHSHCILTRKRGVDGEAGVSECPNCRSGLGDSALKMTDDYVWDTLVLSEDASGAPITQQTYEVAVVLCQDIASPIDSAILVTVSLLKPRRREFFNS